MNRTIFRTALPRAIAFGCCCVLLLGCMQEETAEQVNLTPFFNLKSYIDAEVVRLEREHPQADKQITFNEQTEAHAAMTLNYENELSIFRDMDINRPAWLDKYRIDTVREAAQTIVHYVAIDSALTTRELVVTQQGEAVLRVEVNSRTGTVLSKGRQYLRYEPATGYLIDSYQDRRMGESLNSRIEVRFPG